MDIVFSTLFFCLCYVLLQVSVLGSQKKESHPHTANEACTALTSQSDCFTQRNSLFNKEALQVKCSMRTQYQQVVMVSQGTEQLPFKGTHSRTHIWKLTKCLRGSCLPLHFSTTQADGDIWSQMKPLSGTYQSLLSPLMWKCQMKRSWSAVFLTSNKSRCWDEIRVEAVWRMTLRGRTKYVLVLIWSRELYELCSARRGRGRPPQVKQLFEDEIIVWLHLFTPMAQRGSAKQHNWLCYLIAASTSLCKDIFQFSVWLKGHFVQPLALSSKW